MLDRDVGEAKAKPPEAQPPRPLRLDSFYICIRTGMPSTLGTILGSITFWSGMALATLLVFLVVRRRGRRQREQWKEQEREWGLLDPDDEDEPPDDENLP